MTIEVPIFVIALAFVGAPIVGGLVGWAIAQFLVIPILERIWP